MQREQAEAAVIHVVREVDVARIPYYVLGGDTYKMNRDLGCTTSLDFVDLSWAKAVRVPWIRLALAGLSTFICSSHFSYCFDEFGSRVGFPVFSRGNSSACAQYCAAGRRPPRPNLLYALLGCFAR
jgi:hypothetical protein